MNMATTPDLDGQPLELLIKIMRMTEAEDNIALTAIRRANNQLKKMGTDWEAVLRGKVKIIADPFASINIPASVMNPNRNQDYTPAARPMPPRRPQPPPPPPPDPDPGNSYMFTSRPQPQPRSRPQPAPRPTVVEPPGPKNPTSIVEKTVVNKHDGTCHKCGNKVLAGHGLAKLYTDGKGTTRWWSEHDGPCPTTKRTKPATTTDNFQI